MAVILVLVPLAIQLMGQETGMSFDLQNTYYSNSDITAENIYPNPASKEAILRYHIDNPQTEAKIVVHDLLGTMNRDYPLNQFESVLKIDVQDFREGVYFYTLYADGESKVTKKLIVKK